MGQGQSTLNQILYQRYLFVASYIDVIVYYGIALEPKGIILEEVLQCDESKDFDIILGQHDVLFFAILQFFIKLASILFNNEVDQNMSCSF